MNLYEVLGVAPNDPALKIRARFRLLARATHPDMNHGQRSSAFTRYAQAYKILSDPSQRRAYNLENGINVEPRPLKAGHDLHQRLTLSEADALSGGVFPLQFKRYEPCARCWLSGCSDCAGSGLIATQVNVTMRVPAQTRRAMTVFVESNGGVSEPSGQRGHLFVYVAVAPISEQGRTMATAAPQTETRLAAEPLRTADSRHTPTAHT